MSVFTRSPPAVQHFLCHSLPASIQDAICDAPNTLSGCTDARSADLQRQLSGSDDIWQLLTGMPTGERRRKKDDSTAEAIRHVRGAMECATEETAAAAFGDSVLVRGRGTDAARPCCGSYAAGTTRLASISSDRS